MQNPVAFMKNITYLCIHVKKQRIYGIIFSRENGV